MRSIGWVNAVLGFWLFITPWVLQYGAGSASTNNWLLGIFVFIAAIWSVSVESENTAPAWANVIFGVWLIIAPWVVGFHTVTVRATANDVIVGIIVLVLASSRIRTAHPSLTGSATRIS